MSGTRAVQDESPETDFPPPGPQQATPHRRFQEQQARIAEVTEIMKSNVEKIIKRDENLTCLDKKAEDLEHNAMEFGEQTGKLKRKYWWRNCKMLAILIGIGLVIIVVIVVWAVSVEQ